MRTAIFCLLAVLPGQIRSPGRSPGANGASTSWISGRVATASGNPLPVATITIQPMTDASRADQNRPTTWNGAVTRVKPDGSFRVAVPSRETFQVCATVPGKPEQCKTVNVEAEDLEIAVFAF